MSKNNNEDKTSYYYISDKKKVKLEREPSVRLVKYKSDIPSARSNLSMRANEVLPANSTLVHLKKYNALVIKADEDRSVSAEEVSTELQKIVAEEGDIIDYASIALRQGPNNPDLLFTTKELVARFKDNISMQQIEEILSKYNIKILNQEKWSKNLFRLEAPSADGPNGPIALGNILMESGMCEYAKASFIRERHIRTIVLGQEKEEEDNYYKDQWHLEITKVFDAWNITKGNPDVKICIADTGVEYAHREFIGKIVSGYDFEDDVADGNPKNNFNEDHGTACAGVAVAAGIKAAGAAPQCSLIAIRTPFQLGDIDEANMFVWAADNGSDIISCSWGPIDGFGSVDPIPPETKDALEYCVTTGRNGKGCCIFWAAGNGNESVDDDGYASCEYAMAIAASTNPKEDGSEDRARYSDKGKALFVSAPSSGGTKSILTADRVGSLGYNPRRSNTPDPTGDYTDIFGGTSSATPLVAGIVGLMLSVNPELTVDQIKDILRRTAVKIGDQSSYQPDSNTGLTHSQFYGYGRVNALAAVQEAQKLVKQNSESVSRMDKAVENESIKDIGIRNLVLKQLADESLWMKYNNSN
jgi:subtilisin family serine protease